MYHEANAAVFGSVADTNRTIEIFIIVLLFIKRRKPQHFLPFFTNGENTYPHILYLPCQSKRVQVCRPENLHPFTLTRQIQDMRVGILTIREKWEKMLGLPSFDKKEDDYKDLDRSISISDAAKDGGVCF